MAKQKSQGLLDEIENTEEVDVEGALSDFVQSEEEKTPIDDEIEIRKANIEALRQSMIEARKNNGVPAGKKVTARFNVPSDYILLDKNDVPSKGLFYYPETQIYIRAANVSEIRNWSMWDSDDITTIDSKLNYILKNCVILKDPEYNLTWADLKDMDRLYIVLAIRDLTFPPGTNDLMISIGQNAKIPVRKEHVDFITLPDNLMKRYNEHKRCFCIKTPEDKILDFYIPSLGNTEWVKTYIIEKSRSQEPYDVQFCSKVPYMLNPTVELTEKVFDSMYEKFNTLSVFEASALSEFNNLITKSINPTFTFEDEAGGKQTVPFSFHGGFRSLFVVQNIF